MTKTRLLFVVTLLLVYASNCFAQEEKGPTRWTFEAKKKNGEEYELVAHCLVAKGWHVFSLRPGGDGTIVPTAIAFTKNINTNFNGFLKERGKMIAMELDGVKGKINMFEGAVDFVQPATIKGKGKIFATLTYQSCNDTKCFPPVKKDIVFNVE